ncbi:MAG: M48 family metallopeptidase [Deltaproteobacteria bacterium]|jgi:predicted Zn-dependent protease|nr:M48 family metallopeptidase [Deltaproteobacteria bacterium]
MSRSTTRRARPFHPSACLALFAALAVLSGCAQVVGTGRSQLSLVSDSELNQQSALAYRQTLAKGRLSSNRTDTETIRRVGQRIARAAQILMASEGRGGELSGYSWEFNLLESGDVNAFCMPGGKVAFYSGIMPVCGDDNGVAVVMGHEIAHALARHGAERVSQQMAAEMGGNVLGAVLGNTNVSGGTAKMIMVGYGLGAQYGVLMPFSRTQEAEADRIGLSLMAIAGYNPEAAVGFWGRMQNATGRKGSSEFFSTHPTTPARNENIRTYIPEALQRARTLNSAAPSQSFR